MLRKITDKEYFARGAFQGVFSASLAKTLTDCPEKVFRREAPTDAMSFGSVFHCRVLEPNDFGNRYYCSLKKPPVPKNETKKEGDIRKAAWKEKNDAWEAANEGKCAITESDMDTIEDMAFSLQMRPEVTDLIDRCNRFEISSWWTCDITGVECKAKADGLGDDLVLDLKTAISANPWAFRSQSRSLGYHFSVAHYLDSPDFKGRDYKFLVIEKAPPYAVAVYDLHPELIFGAKTELIKIKRAFKQYHESKIYPGYSGGTLNYTLFGADES